MPTRKKRKTSPRPKPTKRPQAGMQRRGKDGLLASQRQFLEAFRELGRIKTAAEAIGLERNAHYNWLSRGGGDMKYIEAFNAVFREREKLNESESLEIIEELGDPMRGWTEEVLEEEVEPQIQEDGKTKMVVTKAKRRRVKRFSVAAAMWRANRYHGNPARLEVTGSGGGPVQHEHGVSMSVFRAIANAGRELKGAEKDDGEEEE